MIKLDGDFVEKPIFMKRVRDSLVSRNSYPDNKHVKAVSRLVRASCDSVEDDIIYSSRIFPSV